jgi:AraC-like DNA-binding protein
MLLAGRTIVETALDSGFSDQSHFSRYFKKIVGVTPGVFVRYNRQEGI